MSFSLKISGGDLVMSGSQLGIVYGTGKLVQDLELWMMERYGIDRFVPLYGSNLQNYIGGVISTSTQTLVYNEVMRVLDGYQKIQFAGLKAAPQRYSLSELLWSINSVNVTLSYDTVTAAISVSNGQQQQTTISVSQST